MKNLEHILYSLGFDESAVARVSKTILEAASVRAATVLLEELSEHQRDEFASEAQKGDPAIMKLFEKYLPHDHIEDTFYQALEEVMVKAKILPQNLPS